MNRKRSAVIAVAVVAVLVAGAAYLARETGWGQSGPKADVAAHDLGAVHHRDRRIPG